MQNENKSNIFSINQCKVKIITKQAHGDYEGTDFVFVSAGIYCYQSFTFCSVISNRFFFFFENTLANKQPIVAERGREERRRRGEAGISYC